MIKVFAVLVSLFALAPDALGQPLRFVCDPPREKRVEQGSANSTEHLQWTDGTLENIKPTIVIDGESFSVAWGRTITEGSKDNLPRPATYVFAAAYRDDVSILGARSDRTTAEIFRFYFSSKVLYKLTSGVGPAQDYKNAPSMAAIDVADCRER